MTTTETSFTSPFKASPVTVKLNAEIKTVERKGYLWGNRNVTVLSISKSGSEGLLEFKVVNSLLGRLFQRTTTLTLDGKKIRVLAKDFAKGLIQLKAQPRSVAIGMRDSTSRNQLLKNVVREYLGTQYNLQLDQTRDQVNQLAKNRFNLKRSIEGSAPTQHRNKVDAEKADLERKIAKLKKQLEKVEACIESTKQVIKELEDEKYQSISSQKFYIIEEKIRDENQKIQVDYRARYDLEKEIEELEETLKTKFTQDYYNDYTVDYSPLEEIDSKLKELGVQDPSTFDRHTELFYGAVAEVNTKWTYAL